MFGIKRLYFFLLSIRDTMSNSRWKIIQIITAICCMYGMFSQCASDKKLYISLEHPIVDYSDPEFTRNLVVKAKRLSRSDPVHYLTINFTLMTPFDNRARLDFVFYELLSNVYKPSFVEWHSNACEFLEDDFLGASLREAYAKTTGDEIPLQCPMSPGNYSFPNMFISLGSLLERFPFRQGRVYVNVTRVRERAVTGHIDFQIRSYHADRYAELHN